MATTDTPDEPVEECLTAATAVEEITLESCTSREAIVNLLARRTGVETDLDVDGALQGGLDERTCESRRGLREWVTARAAQIIEDRDVSPDPALEQAWGEAADGCADFGVEV